MNEKLSWIWIRSYHSKQQHYVHVDCLTTHNQRPYFALQRKSLEYNFTEGCRFNLMTVSLLFTFEFYSAI
jgi:hypothetical protein